MDNLFRKGVIDLIKEVLTFYRIYARAFLITAAVLFVFGSFVSSCALSGTLARFEQPATALEDVGHKVTARSQVLARWVEEQAKRGTVDPKVMAELVQENECNWCEMGRAQIAVASQLKSGMMAFVLGLLGVALLALIMFGLVMLLIQAALIVAVADRLLGEQTSWRQHWSLVACRLGSMLWVFILAALLSMVGYLFLVLLGLVISCFFLFVALVVLVEGMSGLAALRRSVALVRSDWLRVALVIVTFGLLNLLAQRLVGVIVSGTNIFWSTFLGNLIALLFMPVPIILSVLLYIDIRSRADGFSWEKLAEVLAVLRGG